MTRRTSQSGPVWDTFLIRVVGGGLYGHVLFTGLTGIGFAYLVTRRSALSRRLIGFALCVAAGWLRLKWLPVTLFMAIGKFARYLLVAATVTQLF